MAEILHQLRLVVFPIIYRVSAPSQVVVWDFSHQQYVSFREGRSLQFGKFSGPKNSQHPSPSREGSRHRDQFGLSPLPGFQWQMSRFGLGSPILKMVHVILVVTIASWEGGKPKTIHDSPPFCWR